MSDDVSDPQEEYAKTVKSLETLRRLLEITTDPKRKVYLEAQISRLTLYRERLEGVVEVEPAAPSADAPAAPKRVLTFLSKISKRYERYDIVVASKDKEIQSVVTYMLFFEDEYLALFDKKRLDLDHMSLQELDGFYNLFNQAKRRMEIFCNETESLYDEAEGGGKLLKKLKAKQNLLVEVFRFFKRIERFTGEMIEDIDTTGRRCFNGAGVLAMSATGRRPALNGLTVRTALAQVNSYAREVIDFLDIPDFQR